MTKEYDFVVVEASLNEALMPQSFAIPKMK
jgi:hypothetical protein